MKKLSIAVITMNRCAQLIEALESCVACDLPKNTEFVILDNGSTDDTKKMVEDFINCHKTYDIRYVYSENNLGVGGGRSEAFRLSCGEFVYFLDDDAVIDPNFYNSFFIDSISYMEKNREVASLTTRIYDEMLLYNREVETGKKKYIDGLPIIFKFLGGSHFLRHEYYKTPLYFDIKYGCEEYAPSIRVQDKGFYHVYDDHISIIHKPKRNKWVLGSEEKGYIEGCGQAVRYATKLIYYPAIFYPLLWILHRVRCVKYLRPYPGAYTNTKKLVKRIIIDNKDEKIRVITVLRFIYRFGLTTL